MNACDRSIIRTDGMLSWRGSHLPFCVLFHPSRASMGIFTALCTMEKSHDQHMHDEEARLKSLHAIAHALVAY